MDNKKIPTCLGTAVLIVIAITAGIFVWVYERGQNSDAVDITTVQPGVVSEKTAVIDERLVDNSAPFQYKKGVGFYGMLTLTGYLDIKQRLCNPGEMCTKTVDYASFIIISTDNDSINNFLKENKGNSFVGINSIGLGCYEKDAGRIYSKNEGDDKVFENIITGDDLKKLLESNKSSIVKLEITKPVLTTGGDTSECYSHFKSFKILP